MRVVAGLRRSLERLAAQAPVLVTVDDLQHADPVTLLALRVLPRQLAARPLSWILARSLKPREPREPREAHAGAAQLFDLLDHDGAGRLLLRPLPAAAIAQVIADRLGGAPDADLLLDWAVTLLADAGAGHAGVLCRLIVGQVADARDGPAAAMSIVSGVYELIGDVRWPLIHDPGTAPWLVRLALAAGDRKRAARVAGLAAGLGRLNPAFPTVTAAHAHAAGLLNNDARALELAARTQPDPWASASAAADLAALLADADRAAEQCSGLSAPTTPSRPAARAATLSASAARSAASASAAGARTRGGAPPSGPKGPATARPPAARADPAIPAPPGAPAGLDSLTEAERAIAELVCQGLTNRQIAERTFVSGNTVAFHLRNVYRKLRITSRVQLARAVLDARRP